MSTTTPPPVSENTTSFEMILPFEIEDIKLQAIIAKVYSTSISNVEITKSAASRRRSLLLMWDGTVFITVTYDMIKSTPTEVQAKKEITKQMEEGITSVVDDDGDHQIGMIVGLTLGGIVLVVIFVILVLVKGYNMPCTPCEPCAPLLCSVCWNNDTQTPDTTAEDSTGEVDAVIGQAFHTTYMPNTTYRDCLYQHCSQCQYT